MANAEGQPELFKCPKTGRIAKLQLVVPRATPPFKQPVEEISAKKKKKAVALIDPEPTWWN